MCVRTCPRCGSTEHTELYGICGLTIWCDCGQPLAHRADPAWAPLDRDQDEWAAEKSGVIIGAEARDPGDDEKFGANRWAMEESTS